MRERDVEKYLVKRVKDAGGEVRKVKWIGRRSAPDRLVLLPAIGQRFRDIVPGVPLTAAQVKGLIAGAYLREEGRRAAWVELKAPGKKATFPAGARERAQHREHERLRRFGERVEVIDSFEEVDALIG